MARKLICSLCIFIERGVNIGAWKNVGPRILTASPHISHKADLSLAVPLLYLILLSSKLCNFDLSFLLISGDHELCGHLGVLRVYLCVSITRKNRLHNTY